MERSIRFDNWIWNPHSLELRNGTHVVSLEPRVARLFEYLVTHPGELQSHDRIVEAVWDGRVVSDEAIRKAVSALRQALALDGADSYIRTIHKKGYLASFPAYTTVDQSAGGAADVVDCSTTPEAEAEVESQQIVADR